MYFVIHQIRRDIRGHAVPLAVWVSTLALISVARLLRLDVWLEADPRAYNLRTIAASGAYALQVAGWLIAARIVQADSLVESTGFWLTRPLTARQLFAAKALMLLGTFVVVPALCSTLVAATQGVDAALTAQFFVQRAFWHARWLVPVLLLASVTRDLPRFVFVLVLCGFVFVGHLSAVSALGALRGPFASHVAVRAGIGAFLLLAGFGLVAHQYLTRRTEHTVRATVLVVVISVAVDLFWPLSSVAAAPSTRPPQVSVSGSDSVVATLGFTWGSTSFVTGTLDVSGVPADWVCVGAGGTGYVRPANSSALPITVTTSLSSESRTITRVLESIEAATGAVARNNSAAHQLPGVTVLRGFSRFPDSTFAGPFDVGLDLRLGMVKPRLVARLPLQRGASVRTAGQRVTSVGVIEESGRLVVQLDVATPTFPLRFGARDCFYVLHNRHRHELIWLGATETRSQADVGVFPGEVWSRRLAFGLVTKTDVADAVPVAWLRDPGTEVLVLTYDPVGTVYRHVEVRSPGASGR